MLKEEFLKLVQAEMESQGLSQSELGRRMGISQPVVSQYIRGQSTPGLDVVEKFFRALGIEPAFSGRRESRKKTPAA